MKTFKDDYENLYEIATIREDFKAVISIFGDDTHSFEEADRDWIYWLIEFKEGRERGKAIEFAWYDSQGKRYLINRINKFGVANKKEGECPVCSNTIGFAFGTCVECGYNYLSEEFSFIEVRRGQIPNNLFEDLSFTHCKSVKNRYKKR